MATTEWLIGSHPNVPACTFDVTVGATTESFSIRAGAYYLWNNSVGFDLLNEFQDALNSHSLLSPSEAEVFMGQNRLVQANSNGSAYSVTWTGDTTARNMMGFTGALSSSTAHEANAMSAFFWSPGKQGSPDARPGSQGHQVSDGQMSQAGTGTVRYVRHNTYRRNGYTWRNVDIARVHSTSENSGEWFTFWDQVIERGRKFKLLRNVDEDTTSSAAATMTGDLLGPYVWPETMTPWVNAPRREQRFVEVRSRVHCKMNTVPEYT